MLHISSEPNYHVRRLFGDISRCESTSPLPIADHHQAEFNQESPDQIITPDSADNKRNDYSKSTETKLVRGTYVCALYEKIAPMASIFTYASPFVCETCYEQNNYMLQCAERGLCQREVMAREYGVGTDKRIIIGLDPLREILENRVLKPALLAPTLGYSYTRQHGSALLVCGQRNIGKRYCVQEFCRVNRFNYIGLDARGQKAGLVTETVDFARSLGQPSIIFLDQFDMWAGQDHHAKYVHYIGELFHVLRSGALPPFVWFILGSNLPSTHFYTPYKQELTYCGATELSVGHPQGTSDAEQRFWLLHTFVDSKTNGALVETQEDKTNLSDLAQTLPAHPMGSLWKMLESKLADVVSRAEFADVIAASEQRTPETLRRVFFEIASASATASRKRPANTQQVVSPTAVRNTMNSPVSNPPLFYSDEVLGSGPTTVLTNTEYTQFAFEDEDGWN